MIETTLDGLRTELPGTRARSTRFEVAVALLVLAIMVFPLVLLLPVLLWMRWRREPPVSMQLDRTRLTLERNGHTQSWLLEDLASVRWERRDPPGRRRRRGLQPARYRHTALIVRDREGNETVYEGLLRHTDKFPSAADYTTLCSQVHQGIDRVGQLGAEADVPEMLQRARVRSQPEGL